MRIRMLAILSSIALVLSAGQSLRPEENPVILEASNEIHGAQNHVCKKLLVRLKTDGTVDWEKYLDVVTFEKYETRIPKEEVVAIQGRLSLIDLSTLREEMGRYATYVDTSVHVKIHLVTPTTTRDLTLINPWNSTLQRYKVGDEKVMPVSVKNLVCEISRLRHKVSDDAVDPVCERTNGGSP